MTESKKDCVIYGVDTTEEVTPIMVRDALVACFTEAHSRELDDLKSPNMDEQSFERMKRINLEMMIRENFKDCGGDFDAPTKESIIEVIQKLAEFAKNFRDQKLVQSNYEKIMKLIDKL